MKSDGAKGLLKKTAEQDEFEAMDLNELKGAYELAFGEKVTNKTLRYKFLEIDDLIKDGGYDGQYSCLDSKELEIECQKRKLPSKVGKDGLKAILRANVKFKESESTKASQGYRQAIEVANASAMLAIIR
jgi:hypothetical protein